MYRLVFAWGTFADYPIVLATSRDGRRAPPSRPYTVLRDEPRAVISHVAGVEGTLLGYNEHGVVVFARRPPAAGGGPSLRDVLGRRSAVEATRVVERAFTPATAAGDLLVCDARNALSIETGCGVAVTPLTPGVHVFVGPIPDRGPGADDDTAIEGGRDAARSHDVDAGPESGASGERSDSEGKTRGSTGGTGSTDGTGGATGASGGGESPPDSTEGSRGRLAPRFETARRLYDGLRPEPGESGPDWCRRAREALGEHDHGICVHGPAGGERRPTPARIETRSAASLVIDAAGAVDYAYADGPPCSTPFRAVPPFP